MTARNPTSSMGSRRIVLGALGYALLVYLLLPGAVVAHNDDFGYLRSVVETLQHGRPWTNDWLEPWAASFSSLSALLFMASGSFYFATYGLLAMLAAIACWAVGALFLERGFSPGKAVMLAVLFLTFPTIMWKTLEFTSVALHVPCLLLALWAGEKRRWGLFLVVWLLAIAGRQSAVAWATIPVVAAARGAFGETRRAKSGWMIAAPLAVVGAGGAFVVWCKYAMNKTHAQHLLTDHIFNDINPLRAGNFWCLAPVSTCWPRAWERLRFGGARPRFSKPRNRERSGARWLGRFPSRC